MKKFYAYIRVSTAKQGEHGVSLTEQRDAIQRHAEKNDLVIETWFEERETAAKRGRPVFTEMLALLQQGKATGVIIHKIDRSARNLRDWADLGELIDRGIVVHFANESLDLHTRGGRLSADIQAVVAADYIRNLREEAKKGIYGRLKQGFYPMPAPLGYLDRGAGKAKDIDPIAGPLVRKAFELYGSGKYNLKTLVEEIRRLGLRNRAGKGVSVNGLSAVLNNPFYTGLIRIRRTGETFSGKHAPLIPPSLFNRVQGTLQGKAHTKAVRHEFLFRQLLSCGSCGSRLVGERQKGHVYYRCHTATCPTTGVREETVDKAFLAVFAPLRLDTRETEYLASRLRTLQVDWEHEKASRREVLSLRLPKLEERLTRITDAFLDGLIDRESFENRKTALLMERQEIRDQLLTAPEANRSDRLAEILELVKSAYVSYEMGLPEEKRELVEIITSNRVLTGKQLEASLKIPFEEVAERFRNSNGGPRRAIHRTWNGILDYLVKWLALNPEAPALARLAQRKNTRIGQTGKGEEVAA